MRYRLLGSGVSESLRIRKRFSVTGVSWAEWESLPGGEAFLSATRDTLYQAYTRPRFPGWPRFQKILGERVHAFLKKGGSAASVHDQLEGLYQEVIK